MAEPVNGLLQLILRFNITQDDRITTYLCFEVMCLGAQKTCCMAIKGCISIAVDGPPRARLPIPSTAATFSSCLYCSNVSILPILWSLSFPSCLYCGHYHYHYHQVSSHPSLPGSRLKNFYRVASSALLQLVNKWLDFTYSRSHAFCHGRQKKSKNPALTRIELTTSALLLAGVRGYPLDIDHSGNEYNTHTNLILNVKSYTFPSFMTIKGSIDSHSFSYLM